MTDSTKLLEVIATAVVNAALEPHTTYVGLDGSNQPMYAPTEPALGALLSHIGQDLWGREEFRELIAAKMVDRVDTIADAMVGTLKEKAITVKCDSRYGGSSTNHVDPTLLAALKDVLVEKLREHPALLGDRIDEGTLARMDITVSITAKG